MAIHDRPHWTLRPPTSRTYYATTGRARSRGWTTIVPSRSGQLQREGGALASEHKRLGAVMRSVEEHERVEYGGLAIRSHR
ncbi:MAG: hypothetical protein M3Z54_03065 [Gemmatimonadota bacterium]|nr:hypothetical protein [Gemmatimonadota bacterium]